MRDSKHRPVSDLPKSTQLRTGTGIETMRGFFSIFFLIYF